MPAVIGLFAGAVVGLVAATSVAGFAASKAFEAISGSFLTPSVGAGQGRPTEWTADPDAPIPFVSGRRGVAGQIVHRDTFGPNNRYQWIVTVYSGGGPINGYSDFIVDGTTRTFTGEIMDGTPANALYRQTKTGAQPDTALTGPTVTGSYTPTGWTSSHKLSGFACSGITLFQDGDFKRWPTGEPKVIQVLTGMLAYDPRQDSTYPGGSGACRLATPSTWVYSTNPIIHALKWCLGIKHNGVLIGGLGMSISNIDTDAFIAAANIADTNSWTVSAVAYSLDDKYEVLAAYLQAGGAIPARKAGKISCVSRAAAAASTLTISTADTAGPFELTTSSPREGRINTIIPRCVSENHDWEMVALSPVTNSTYVTEDNSATRSRGVDYPYVSSVNQAAQLARYDIADSREGLTGTIPMKPHMRQLEPGMCFTITEDGFALSGQKFMVLSRSYDPKTDVVSVTVRSETNAKHAWALAGTGTAPSTPSLGGTDPQTVSTPAGGDWSVAAGAGTLPSVVLTGAVPTGAGVSKIFVEYKKNADSTWIPVGEFTPDTTKVDIPSLAHSTSYDVGVTYRNLNGALGSRLTKSATTSGTVNGGGITSSTVATAQLATQAATGLGYVFSDSTYTASSSSSTINNFQTLTVTTTDQPLIIEFSVVEQTSSSGGYEYYISIDDTVTWTGSAATGYWAQVPLDSGTGSTVKKTQGFRLVHAGLSAASHTFKVWLRNNTGASMSLSQKSLTITEMKKSV